jgi:hypothetical protein
MQAETDDRARTRTDLVLLGALAVELLLFILLPTLRRHLQFGVGPDMPVYLWWGRVGASEGISLVRDRPGIAVMVPVVAGTLHQPLVAATAGIEYAMAASVGVVATALVRGRALGGRGGWLLAGALSGAFAVHLGGGYVSSLGFTLAFFAVGTALAVRTRRGTDAAAFLLGGGGLIHPQFFMVGAGILGLTALWSWLREPEHGWTSDGGRVAVAVAGGGALMGAGMLASLAGPARLQVDTSKDAFLRRAGLSTTLHALYRARFWKNANHYAPWVMLPAAILGVPRTSGFTRRFLVAWAVVTILGVPVGILTGWFPPERIITFSFALPTLAALGIVWGWHLGGRRARVWIVRAVGIAVVAVMIVAAWITWNEQSPYLSPDYIRSTTTAGRIAATLPPGTPLVFIVNDNDTTVIFLATQVGNVLRAGLPPDRAKDIYIYVGDATRFFERSPTVRGDLSYDTLSRTSLAAIPQGPAAVFVVREFDRDVGDRQDPHLVAWSDSVWSTVPGPTETPVQPNELQPSSSLGIALATLLAALLLWGVGFGWARWTFDDLTTAVASAPGFGVAALALAGVTLERIGLPLTGSWGPTLVSMLAGGLGYLLLILQRKAHMQPVPEVEERHEQ